MEEFCGTQFWDSNLTWFTEAPEFTSCFEKTVLVWVPCGYLWLVAALEIYYLYKSRDRCIPWSFLNVSKLISCAALLVVQVLDFAYNVDQISNTPDKAFPNDILCPVLLFCSILLATVFVVLEKKRGIQSCGCLVIFWLLMTLCGIPRYSTSFGEYKYDEMEQFPFVLLSVSFPLTVVMLLLSCFADSRPEQLHYSRGPKSCPELEASFFNRLVFAWLEPLVWKGFRRPLKQDMLWELSEENSSRKVVRVWDKSWKASKDKAYRKHAERKKETVASYSVATDEATVSTAATAAADDLPLVSVLPTMSRTFGTEFLTGTFMKIIYDILQFVAPQILSLLIAFTDDPNVETWKGYLYASALFVTTLVQSLLLGQYSVKMYLVGQRMRTGIISAVYRKSLVISSSARKESTVGEIVNLMSIDAQRFMDLTIYLNMLLSAPLTLALAIYFLWQILGPSALAGLLALLILIPLNGVVANRIKTLQIQQMKYKDQRVKIMNEILNGMKVLKLYAWEPAFENQVLAIRKKEVEVLKKTAYYNASISFFFTLTPFVITFSMFMTYVLLDESNRLTSEKIFVSMSLMNILRVPLFMVPFLIIAIVQSSVSLKRLNKFLNADEIDPDAVERLPQTATMEDAVKISGASFSWDNSKNSSDTSRRPEDTVSNSHKNATTSTSDESGTRNSSRNSVVLHEINMSVKTGSLVAVVGIVGSGKTSLCSALLGEMEKITGSVVVKGRIAYVPQLAWIQNSLLRDNILFGDAYDEQRYNSTLSACALVDDLSILPAGDMTEIGEKGINLSGGQKQRVSLARAVYSQSDVYVLDDPLSAVDAHVGKHIFNHVIGPHGLLKNKTRLLVTHGVTYLPRVDHIIVMKDGRISEQGSYQELLSSGGDFQAFLMQHLVEQEQDGDENEEVAELNELKSQLEQCIGRESFQRQLSSTASKTRTISETSSGGGGSVRKRKHRHSSATAAAAKTSKGDRHGAPAVGEKLIQDESSATGKVKWSVYMYYVRAVGAVMMLLTMFSYIASQSCSVMSNIWLTKWSDDNTSTQPHVRDMYLGVYAGLGIGQGVFVMAAGFIMAAGTVLASWQMNKNMLRNIMRSPMSFFDMTPTGRIVNRFSKDLDTIDTLLPMNLRNWLQFFFMVVATFFVIIYATPMFAVIMLPCIIIYYGIQTMYVRTSRQLKRIESVARSPIYSHFGESIQGVSTIRAYGKQDDFIVESEKRVDQNQMSYFPSIVANRWLSVRLEFIGNLLTFFAAVFAVLARGNISSGIVGLSISYAQSVTQILYILVRMASDVETNIVSVERVKEYSETPQEAAWDLPKNKPSQDWPEEGVVNFSKFSTRYREGLDLVVKDIDCCIEAGEKIGIVGRTGAGKSSLTMALFRIIEAAAGHIIIDGIDIAKIGLHDLRSRLTIIPQDPVLFSGPLRVNLDPFERYSDEMVWASLEQAHLKGFISGLANGLQFEVSEGGENFSVGQRQLICLARALLRKSRILVMDEATAAVDLDTDDLIQNTIRQQFANCTVITIAHRLNTIMDNNRIMVLDNGVVKEFASPSELLLNHDSMFYSMAKDAGLVQ